MAIFKKKETSSQVLPVLANERERIGHPFYELGSYMPEQLFSYRLYRALREAVPIIDAAVYKTVRLTGGFKIETEDGSLEAVLKDFTDGIISDCSQTSLQSFVDIYLEQLLTYGTAVAEMVTDEDGRVVYLYNAPIDRLCFKRSKHDYRQTVVCLNDGPEIKELEDQEKLLYSALNADAGKLTGNSVLRGLPYVSNILLKIYNAVGANWDRVGNLRFAVTYKPSDDAGSKAYAKQRAIQIANEWGEVMNSDKPKDFIALGDVDIKVIGADNQILDSEIPVRQLLEQIVAKLALPPFMLGLSWSTTERMSQQQADALTTELECYRRILTPVIKKICSAHLRAYGYTKGVNVIWDDITLKDTLDEANANYLRAKADEIYEHMSTSKEGKDG